MRFYRVAILLLISTASVAQTQSFRLPLEIPPAFSGTFGEIRSDHFHSGVDLRTMGKVGFNVFAIEKGFVSRIKVSPVGFGKAIYIDHPNGKTSVYAHLDRFTGKIAEYAENAQYQKPSFEIELFPNPGELPVNKGDIIAISGNSGSSGGPHLHLEIRETVSQHILDPFEFFNEWRQTDIYPPVINRLLVFEIDSLSYLLNSLTYKAYETIKRGSDFTLPFPVNASGKVGLALYYYDTVNPNSFRAGIKKAEMKINGIKTFTFQVDKFSFLETRYANGFNGITDNGWSGYKAIRLWTYPNNKFSGITHVIDHGIIDVAKDSTYIVDIRVWDHSGNSSKLTFKILGVENKAIAERMPNLPLFKWNAENTYKTRSYMVRLPENALFHDILFQMSESQPDNFPYPIVTVHNSKTKLFKKFTLEYNTSNIAENLLGKLYIAKINGKGFTYVGSEPAKNSIKAICNSFGKYTVMIDTIAPSIIAQNLIPNAKITSQSSISFKLIDNTGIKTYNGYIDGKWVLFEWDPKTGILLHNLNPKRTKRGQWHSLKIVVTDMLNNNSEYSTKFYW
ncbi:MAG TPA: M23 family metallopeptidase [Bacteroidales bacterium]|nr:M23 family metallopeptidase [Bacteroidales bacterium]